MMLKNSKADALSSAKIIVTDSGLADVLGDIRPASSVDPVILKTIASREWPRRKPLHVFLHEALHGCMVAEVSHFQQAIQYV